jgi:hypothetical protein
MQSSNSNGNGNSKQQQQQKQGNARRRGGLERGRVAHHRLRLARVAVAPVKQPREAEVQRLQGHEERLADEVELGRRRARLLLLLLLQPCALLVGARGQLGVLLVVVGCGWGC